MVKSNKKTINRSPLGNPTVKTPTSRFVQKKTRTQLIKILKDLGIKVPASLSLKILRELVVNNHASTRELHFNANDSACTTHQLPGSFPCFDIESDAGDDLDQETISAQEKFKTTPRTYSLFDCPIGDCSNVPPTVEFISPSLRKAIQEGKDVCLAHLLIPQEHSFSQYKDGTKDFTSLYLKSTDPRLHRSLTLPEFILAFIRYLNVMTEVHQERRAELTYYLSFIVKIGVQFPHPLFYEYHKNFSRKAASILSTQGRKIDWSIRDDDLYFQIFAGRRARTCEKCSSVDHTSDFCPSIVHADLKTDLFTMPANDSRSRTMVWQRFKRTPVFTADQREICFNFNGHRGCSNTFCQRAHVCLKCQQTHPQKDCRPVAPIQHT